MKKNGFTLVELLAVIVVLSIILVIAIPKINSIISNSKNKLYETTIKEIEKSASQYVTMHPELLDQSSFTITIQSLCNESLIDCPVIDPRDNSAITGGVLVTEVNSSYQYQYKRN